MTTKKKKKKQEEKEESPDFTGIKVEEERDESSPPDLREAEETTEEEEEEAFDKSPYHETRLNQIEQISGKFDDEEDMDADLEEIKDDGDKKEKEEEKTEEKDKSEVKIMINGREVPLEEGLKTLVDVGTVPIKVEGEEMEVPLSKALEEGKKTLQKETTADRRLRELAELKKQIEMEAEEKKKQASLSEGKKDVKPEDKSSTSPPMTPDIDGLAADLVQAVQYGDEDEAVDKFKRVLKDLYEQKPQQTKNIGETVREELARIQEAETAQKVKELCETDPDNGGFKDLMEDPYLFDAFYGSVNRKIYVDNLPNTIETYIRAAKETREWRDGNSESNDSKKISISFGDKIAKKKSQPSPPKGVSVKPTYKETTELSEEEDNVATIKEYRKQRGGY